MCLESRVFYRLISGTHASISAHIAREYYFADEDRWGPSIDIFAERLARPEHKYRLENLYFTYLFVLRAVRSRPPAPPHRGLSS